MVWDTTRRGRGVGLVDTLGEVAVLQMHPRSSGHELSRTDAVRYAERIVRTQLVSRLA